MDMIKRILKCLIMSVVVMIFFFVTSVDARNLDCSYDLTYTGYSNNEEKIRLIISNEDNNLHEEWVNVNSGSKNPLNNINSKSNYINKLEFNDFKDGDNFVCPKISYTIVKDNNDGFRVYVGLSNAGYLNSISPSGDNSNNDDNQVENNNQDDTNSDDNNSTPGTDNSDLTSSPSPSPSDSLEKIEWEKVGDDVEASCESTMGELIDELQRYFDMIKIIAPILLIVFGALDFAGATTGMNNKDTMEKTTNKFIKRCIAALAIFFLPTLIEVVFTLPGLPEIEEVLCGLK